MNLGWKSGGGGIREKEMEGGIDRNALSACTSTELDTVFHCIYYMCISWTKAYTFLSPHFHKLFLFLLLLA